MDEFDPDVHLNQISTLWTVVRQAGDQSSQLVAEAQHKLLERYGRAIHRYLLGALRDPDAADELAQEFALRFIRGDLAGVDKGRGRFRDFIKGVLFHLIADYHRRRGRFQSISARDPEPAAQEESTYEQDRQFLASWRELLLQHAWEGLEKIQTRTCQPYHAVLHMKMVNAAMQSDQLAEMLSAQLGKHITSASLRQTLHRARKEYIDLLVEEVIQTLEEPTAEKLEQEFIDLGLHKYCKEALTRYRRTQNKID
jgi:RNA polymerase sigma-70 factor (ECF subfamily)